jgi:hypothetical protein
VSLQVRSNLEFMEWLAVALCCACDGCSRCHCVSR